MRSVFIGDSRLSTLPSQSDLAGELRQGYEAYRLLLEIVCGLRSRLLGETEVMAQFKSRFQPDELPAGPLQSYLIQLRDQLVEDARRLRSEFLTGLGDQSYGGIAHRLLPIDEPVTLVGSGQLAEKVIPWLLKRGRRSGKGRRVRIAARNAERMGALAQRFHIETARLDSLDLENDNLVIAAPASLPAAISTMTAGRVIVDFREAPPAGEQMLDLVYHSFASILASLNETIERNRQLKQRIEPALADLVKRRELAGIEVVHGWEDLHCRAV